MNRFKRYCLYTLFVVLMGCSVIAAQQLMLVPKVYSSIHQMGQRAGNIIPHGYTQYSQLSNTDPKATVTLKQYSSVVTVKPGQHPQTHLNQRSPMANLDLRAPMIIVAVYLTTLFMVTATSLWRRSHLEYRRVNTKLFTGILALGSCVCVVIATMLCASRIFWTGVNQAFYSRSTFQIEGSSTSRINGNQLLSMGQSELFMMMVAMILTAIPLLYWIDKQLFKAVYQHDTSATMTITPSRISKVYERWIAQQNWVHHTIKCACFVGYGLVVAFLWCSPWSTTIVNTIVR